MALASPQSYQERRCGSRAGGYNARDYHALVKLSMDKKKGCRAEREWVSFTVTVVWPAAGSRSPPFKKNRGERERWEERWRELAETGAKI